MTSLKKPLKFQQMLVMILDIIVLYFSNFFALFLRFEFHFTKSFFEYSKNFIYFSWVFIIVMLILFWLAGLYHFVWRMLSLGDAIRIGITVLLANIVSYSIAIGLGFSYPRSIPLAVCVLQIIMFSGIRLIRRILILLDTRFGRNFVGNIDIPRKRVMIVGAGSAGQLLANEIKKETNHKDKLVCFVDDNPNLKGKWLQGVPIFVGRESIPYLAKEHAISRIIYAIPSSNNTTRKEILEVCKKVNCEIKVLPGIDKMVESNEIVGKMRNVKIEDLLGRDEVNLANENIKSFIKDRVILVTGGGGSIGSELVRQIAKYNPKQLIILDIYENNAYEIQQELVREYQDKLNLKVEIASVRDKKQVEDIFSLYRPEIVFHAAAHKHVPLMEDCPTEAIKNNIFGTYHVIRACEKFDAKKMVMISTDKAVNPTNIMGASKRFCEMLIQSRAESKTEFCCVRFGNVLGSNGSVVPLFRKQIEEGGPLTITDKRIIRYFMTIPEAASLVLEAGEMAKQGQVFVLDMGEPVKIVELAENMIRLSGFEPYKDIDIVEIGLRPGEKLFEELLISSHDLIDTPNKKIFIEQQETIDPKEIFAILKELDVTISNEYDKQRVYDVMHKIVPTYHTPEEVNKKALKN